MKKKQSGEEKCRICLSNCGVLLSLCQCSGSIQLVHEDCILKWIAHQLEVCEDMEMPKCQLCHQPYHAQIRIGQRCISYKLLLRSIWELGCWEWVMGTWMLICVIVAISLSCALLLQYHHLSELFLIDFFLRLVFPCFVIFSFFGYCKDRHHIFHDSLVQIVQITLQPTSVVQH